MNNIRAKAVQLMQSPLYVEVVKEIEALKPLEIAYDPKKDNVEEMKFKSAQRQMLDTVLSILKPKEMP